ncbi:MAG: type II toxin-antitoxin system VapC family toxin [Lentisphaeria bacterium]|nr:type II toxin-antitoxin system VapC family toxin [Lentisphaeria bacterium]
MRYMLDTDIASYLIRGDHPEVTAKFTESYEDCVISGITAAELLYGARKRNNRVLSKKVQALCNLIPIIPWGEDAANAYAQLRVDLEKAGTPIGSMDMLIAASAVAEGMTLVTNNVTHFSKIRQLKFESW